MRSISALSSAIQTMRASEPFPLQPTSRLLQSLAEKVSRQRRLRAALAENDRYSLAVHWLLHDYQLTFAAFKVGGAAQLRVSRADCA